MNSEIESFADELVEYAVEHEMCVQPDSQTYDCCDCTVCLQAFRERVIKEMREKQCRENH